MVQQAAVMTAAQHRFMIIGTAQAVAGGACCALAQLTATSNHAPIIRADSLLSKLPVKATEKDDTFARNDTTAIPLPASLPHHWSTRLTHEGAPDQRRARGWLGSWAASPLLTHGAAAAAPAAAAAGSWQPRHPLARSLHSTARPHASQQEGQQQQQPNLDQQHQQQQADPSAAHGGGSVPEGAGSAAASAARASSVPPGRPPNDVVYFGPLSQQHKLLKRISITNTVVALGAAPAIVTWADGVSMVSRVGLAASLVFFGILTTGALHWVAHPYVHELRYEAASGMVRVRTTTLLGNSRWHQFSVEDVQPLPWNRPVATFMARGQFYYIDVYSFPDEALLRRLTPDEQDVPQGYKDKDDDDD